MIMNGITKLIAQKKKTNVLKRIVKKDEIMNAKIVQTETRHKINGKRKQETNQQNHMRNAK